MNETLGCDWFLNPLTLREAKGGLTMLVKSFRQRHNWTEIEGEMLIRTLSTTLFQLFCKIVLNSKVIDINVKEPDDNF